MLKRLGDATVESYPKNPKLSMLDSLAGMELIDETEKNPIIDILAPFIVQGKFTLWP